MGIWRTGVPKMTVACVVCAKPISGYKPYGSGDIYSRRDLEVRVGRMAYKGYRHYGRTECR
jgi:hypothetical protein